MPIVTGKVSAPETQYAAVGGCTWVANVDFTEQALQAHSEDRGVHDHPEETPRTMRRLAPTTSASTPEVYAEMAATSP